MAEARKVESQGEGHGWGVLAKSALLMGLCAGSGCALANPNAEDGPDADRFRLVELGRVEIPNAEIPSFDPATGRVLVSGGRMVHMLEMDAQGGINPFAVVLPGAEVDPGYDSAEVSHVTADPMGRGFAAATLIPARFAEDRGRVVLIDISSGAVLGWAQTGFNPDCVAITADGERLLIANEGEPAFAGAGARRLPDGSRRVVDPVGSISVVELDLSGSSPRIAGTEEIVPRFEATGPVRVHPGVPMTQDLEPESITVLGDRAWVSLQENNAILAVDAKTGLPTGIHALATIDQRIDPGGRVGINIDTVVRSMPMPDMIVAAEVGGRTVLITANEGDDRGEWDDPESPRGDRGRAASLVKRRKMSPDAAAGIERLRVCAFTGDTTADGLIDVPHAFGTRSVSVWDAETFELIGDTGSAFEEEMAARAPEWFNANPGSPGSAGTRSDNRGPEPEGVAFAELGGEPIVFVGFERPGALAVLSLADPASPSVVGMHISARRGDFAPEGMVFVPADRSPTGEDLLIVAYEHSGTLVSYRVERIGR